MSLRAQNEGSLFVPVFLASAATLLYEMVQIRVFSYSLPPILAYAAISLAMTGFGTGATLLSLVPAVAGQRPRATLALLSILQSAGMIAANLVFARESWDVILNMDSTGILPVVLKIVFPCTVPYFFAGLFFAIVFSTGTARIGRLYAWNLVGSGIGTLLLVGLLVPLGAEGLLVLAATMCLLSAAILALKEGRLLLGPTLLLFALCGGLFFFAKALFPFDPDPKDLLGYAIRAREKEGSDPIEKEYGEWNLVSRIEVWNHGSESLNVPEQVPFRMLQVDAGASSLLAGDPGEPGWGRELFEETVYGLAYLAKPVPDRVLVIGPGGGIDIQAALHAGARQITGVEVNQSTIRACKGPYADFLKWPASERVSLIHGDGRSFVKGCHGGFDVIQMSGVDTLTVYATGSLNMVEEYLYTEEAFESYLEALKPGGVLCVLRFGAEYLRLAMIASQALARQGIPDPERHLALFSQNLWTGLVVSKGEFTPGQIESLRSLTSRKIANRVRIPPYDFLKIGLSDPVEITYLPLDEYLPKFREFQEFTASLDSDPKTRRLRKALVPTDDNPFYMLPVLYLLSLPSQLTGGALDPLKAAVLSGMQVVKIFWSGILLVSLVAIFLPVALFRGKMTSYGSLCWVLPYFFLLGLSFMLLEICAINKFAIFTGSPGNSIIVVLSGILVSSGIGSYSSELSGKRPELKIGLATLFMILSWLAFRGLAPVLFEMCWKAGLGQVSRCIVAGILIVPMGFALGWFFPSGLKALQAYMPDRRLLPWAVSINGFASVLGSIAALPISIFFGFNKLAVLGLAGYVLAGALSLFVFRRQPTAFVPAGSPALS